MRPFTLACLLAASAMPALAQIPDTTYAGRLAAGALAANPDVLALSVASIARGATAGTVLASTSAAPGSAVDLAQAAVLAGAAPLQQVSSDAKRLTTTLALLDVSGDPIGALSITTAYAGAADRSAALQRADAIRDTLRRKLINAANLADPVPYVAAPPSAPYAQRLADETMAAHPELLVVALHVANPDASDYPIIASSIGRIGKHADDDDLRVIRSGQPAMGAYGAKQTRYGIELPMFDGAGATIGALSVGYAFTAGDDVQALLRKARQVEAELRARIPTLARLYGPAQ